MSNDRTYPMHDRNYIGGGNVAGILGISPYKTPLDEYLSIIGEAEAPTDEKQKFFDRRKRLEPYAVELFEQETGAAIAKRNARYVDPEHAFIRAEIDAETVDANIEIKSVHPMAASDWGEPGADNMPVYVAAQAMHGLMVTQRELCIVLAMIGFDDLRIYQVKRDDETISAMREKELSFWNDNVLAKLPPPAKNVSDIMKLFAKDNGGVIEASPEVHRAVNTLRDIKNNIKVYEEEKDRLEFVIKEYISPNTTLSVGGKPLATWKAQNQQRFDQERFKKDEPALYSQFTKTISFRVLRLQGQGA